MTAQTAELPDTLLDSCPILRLNGRCEPWLLDRGDPALHYAAARDNSVKPVLLPAENKRESADIPTEVLDMLRINFYSDPINAAFGALEVD